MKKIITLVTVLTAFLIISGCTVNSDWGRIRVTNYADIPAANVKVGAFSIVSYLAPGASYDYWHFTPVVGKPTADGFEWDEVTENEGVPVLGDNMTFETNHHGSIILKIVNDDYVISASKGRKQGENQN